MEQYKVWVIQANEKVEKVIAFNSATMDVFSEEELDMIDKDSVIFTPVQLHKDDSVEDVKKKIVNEIKCNYDELYLFCYKKRTINLLNALTSSTKSVIDKKIFDQFSRNMDLDGLDREIYEHKYLSSLGFNKDQILSIKTGLGMEFKHGYNYLFSPNPFLNDPTVENEVIEKNIYLNDNALIGDIEDNNIYACLAKDVFAQNGSSRIYFPHLAERNIFDSQDLTDAQPELQRRTESMMNESQFSQYEFIDNLYDVYSELPNVKQGISNFNIEVNPSYPVVMPLDAIFKNIHCDAEFPFIKYNPGVRRENVYRLYSTSVSKTGKKIPALPKKRIENLVRTTSNHKQISIYNVVHRLIISIESDGSVRIEGAFKDGVRSIQEVEEIVKKTVNPILNKINAYLINSGYRISTIKSLADVKIVNMNYEYSVRLAKNFFEIKPNANAFILDNTTYRVQPGIYSSDKLVQELSSLLPSGFSVEYDAPSEKFTFFHENREFILRQTKNSIKDILGFGKNEMLESRDFSLTMPEKVNKIVHVNLKNKCIYPVFWIERSNVRKGAVLRFTRVENFQKMNSLATFISDMYKKREEPSDAYNALVAQHGFELNDAKKMVARILGETDVASRNPGLLTTMKLDENTLKVVVNNLNNIRYVETLGIYLNSIVKITQEMVDICRQEEEQYDAEEDEKEEEEAEKEKIQDIRQLFLQYREEEKPVVAESVAETAVAEALAEEDDSSSLAGIYSEDESEDNESQSGGEPSDEESDSEIKGKKYFLNRLTKADPVLFKEVNKKDGKIGRYTRTCPSMQQPVVLSEEEKQYIDEKYRDSYEHAIEYGSSDDKKNWYVCPRFWCFKTNAPMSEADINSGKCGPPADRKKNVFEFTDKKHKDKDGKYRFFNPGFIVDHHPNKDLCLPCCYAEWDSRMHKERRDKCAGEEVSKKKVYQNVAEIMGHNSILTEGRWGYLPISIRRFMQIKYKEEDTFLFLRYGVEKQSFVGCLADIYGKMNNKPAPSVAEMLKIIADSVSPENFKRFGKGSFTTIFGSHENFRKYLLDENSLLDHTYLWDIVCTPNSKLFEKGINLVIMEIVNNDITDKVDVICPLSSYVKNRFDKDRDTVFLINQGTRYEPVYLVDNTKKAKKNPKAFFNLITTAKIPNMHKLLILLDNTLNKYCGTARKEVREYTFKAPMGVDELIGLIGETKGYTVEKQILNYQDRVIALLVKTPSENMIVIPCEPSEQQAYPAEYMDNQALWSDYQTTLDELMELKNRNPNILCQPVVKMYDGGIVVGVLTETNQFIKVVDGDGSAFDGLKSQTVIEDPHKIELAIDNSTGEDPNRIRVVRNITLESSFFTLYRSTIKSLLEDRENRQQIISVIDEKESSYREKLESVKQIIDAITEDVVVYTKMSESVLSKLSEVSYTCGKSETSGMFIDGCRLVVPEKNLISKKNNSTIYAYRVSDEIVRYGRIKNYLLNPNQFLNTGNTDFKINPDEYIISESVLSAKDYFEDIINPSNNEYRAFNSVNGIPYDMAKTAMYLPRMVELQKTVAEKEVECSTVKKFRDQTKDGYWGNHVFPGDAMEIIFKNTVECSFGPLIYIMKQISGKIYDIQELRNMIYDAYSEYLEEHSQRIIAILSAQGKRAMFKSKPDFETTVKSEGYFMTTLDVWVFAQKYRVPIILFSGKNVLHDLQIIQEDKPTGDYMIDRTSIKNTMYNNAWLILGGNVNDRFFFLESLSQIREARKISSNTILQQGYSREQLGDLGDRIKHAFAEKKVISLTDYL